jgi:hypothetical protein
LLSAFLSLDIHAHELACLLFQEILLKVGM